MHAIVLSTHLILRSITMLYMFTQMNELKTGEIRTIESWDLFSFAYQISSGMVKELLILTLCFC